MKKKRFPEEHFAPGEIIHDHFDGSANCVECGGNCKLTGAARVATDLARWQFEMIAVVGGWVNMPLRGTLERCGVDVDYFLERAMKCNPRKK